MIGYARREVFDARELGLLRQAELMVAALPDEQHDGEPVRCHELARAVGRVLELPVCDGRFGFVEHSWLWTRELKVLRIWELPNVLDVYVPGAVPQVQLVDARPALPARYLPGPARTDVRVDVVAYLLTRLQFAELRVTL